MTGTKGQEMEFFNELRQRLSGLNNLPKEFTQVFSHEIIPEFHKLSKNRSNKRIRSFADLITETGRNLKMEMIEAYGNELNAQLVTFNVKKINSMLEEFAILSEAIEDIHTKTRKDE